MQHKERSGLTADTQSDAIPTRNEGTGDQERQTIAQTAHALLRRWEESRAQAGLTESRPSPVDSLTGQTEEADTLGESFIPSQRTASSEHIPPTPEQAWNASSAEAGSNPTSRPTLQRSSPAVTPHKAEAGPSGPGYREDEDFDLQALPTLPKTSPTRAARSPAVPLAESAADSEFSPAKFAALEKTTGTVPSGKSSAFSPGPLSTASGEAPSEFRPPQPRADRGFIEETSSQDRPQEAEKSPVRESRGSSPASANDASQLLRARGMAYPEPEMKNHETHTERPTAEAPEQSALSPSRGGVKFATREQGHPNDGIEFDIHQAIERNCRKQRNWSAILGQLLSLGGALAMTGGFAVVLGNWFGKIDIPETTGWLAVAGGHLLFVLGLYTHLTSRIEQVWHELHGRSDDLQRILLQMQRMQQLQLSRPARETPPRTSPTEQPSRETAANL